MTSDTPWRVILIEPQTLLRTLLAKAINLDPRFILLADDPIFNAELVCEKDPQLVITGDVDTAELVLKNFLGIRILVLTDPNDLPSLKRLKKLGVHGCVEKDQPWEIVEEAITEILSGCNYVTAKQYQLLKQHDDHMRLIDDLLGPRERETLKYLAQGLSCQEIADQLKLSRRSVETYRFRIRKKLNIRNQARLVEFAFRNGLVKPSDIK